MHEKVQEELLIQYLEFQFDQLNIHLTGKQLDYLLEKIFRDKDNSIELNLTKEQLIYTKYSDEDSASEDIEKIFTNFKSQLEKFLALTSEERSESQVLLAKRLAKERLELIYRKPPEYFDRTKQGNIRVQKSIVELWGDILDLFELFISTSTEYTIINDPRKLEQYNENIDLYEALRRLQGRACLIGNEILALLKAGFADGAYARCRTLYETMIISSFISDKTYGGNEIAKRYLDYSIVSDLQESRKRDKYSELLGGKGLKSKDTQLLEKEVDKLKLEYGESFSKGDYSWAYTIRKSEKHKITFSELEEKIDFEHMKIFYKSASNNIHTGSSSLYFHMGLMDEHRDKIFLGASDSGILEPCDLSSYFIGITTANLILYETERTEQIIQVYLLNQLREDINSYIDEYIAKEEFLNSDSQKRKKR